MKDKHNSMDKKNMNLTTNERAERLIQALMCEVPPELREKIQQWFISGANEEGAQQAFVKHMERLLPNESEPTEETRRRFDKLAGILGFPKEEMKVIPLKRKNRWFMKVAAVVLPLLLVTAGYWLYTDDMPKETILATGDVSQEVILPDGSQVVVEPHSSLVFLPGFENGRNVAIEGEAFFCVEGDTANVFTVKAGDVLVKVYGTEFRVNSCTEDVDYHISLYEGCLTVEAGGAKYELDYGERLELNRKMLDASISTIPLREMLDGGYKPRLRFEDHPLRDVFRAMELYYGVTFEIDESVNIDEKNSAIFGDFEGLPLEHSLRIIMYINGAFSYTIDNMNIKITNKNK